MDILFAIENCRGIRKSDSVVQIINYLHSQGLDGREFIVISECPQKGLYAKFDGKYRRVENAPGN